MACAILYLTIAFCLLAVSFAAPAAESIEPKQTPEKDDLETSASHWGGHYGGFGYGYGYGYGYPYYGYYGYPSYGYGWYGHGWPYGYGHGYWW